MRKRVREIETQYKKHLGGGEEGVVRSLRWQIGLKALPPNITTRDLTIEPLDIAFYHALSLEPSPRSGLDVDLVWTRLPHSLDTQSTPHPQTPALHADLTSTATATAYSAKGGPRGRDGVLYMGGVYTLLGDKQSFLVLGSFQKISEFFSQNIFDMDYKNYFQPLANF